MGEKENGAVPTQKGAEIIKQMEYYFGDANLTRDKFLLNEIDKSDEGWIDMSLMMKFNRLNKLAGGSEDVVLDVLKAACNDESLLEVDMEHKRVRRNPAKPMPADKDKFLTEMHSRTVYIKGIDKSKDLEYVEELLKDHGPFESINLRRYKDKEGVWQFKGTVLVTFKDVAGAEKFLAQKELKDGETVLETMWRNDWALEKDEEYRSKRAKRAEKKQELQAKRSARNDDTQKSTPPKKRKIEEVSDDKKEEPKEKKAKGENDKEGEEGGTTEEGKGSDDEEAAEDMEDEEEEKKDDGDMGLFPGSVFQLKGIPTEGVHVMEIRKLLGTFKGVDVGFISFQSGDAEAIVRLRDQDSAKKALEAINANPDKLELNGTKITAVEMGADEEAKFLTEERQKKKEAIGKMKNRSHGGGGRGGRGRGGRGGRGRGRGGGRRGRGGRGRR